MAFTFNRKDYGNINDSGIKDLPLGKHNYEITKITYTGIKADKSGRRKHLVIELRHSEGGSYTRFLEVTPKKVKAENQDNEDTRARIAGDEFNSYLDAVGFPHSSWSPAKSKLCYGKTIGIEVIKTVVKSSKKEFLNVNQIVEKGWAAAELTETGAPEDDIDPDDDIPMGGDKDEVDEEAEAAATEKVALAKKRKAAAAKKKAAAAKAAAEVEDEDEDEDEDPDLDEDEDEEDPFS